MNAPGSAWAPLRHVAFRQLWSAALLANVGIWLHDLAAGWLMATLSTSPQQVALVQAATTLPVCLLAIPAGTLADRMDKRRLLLFIQAGMAVIAIVLGVMVLLGRVDAPRLLGFTFALGMLTALLSPTWQSILPKLVPRPDFAAAVALHSVGINISRAIGPAIAGAIIQAAGIAWPFLLRAVSTVPILWSLWHWRPPAEPARPGGQERFGAAMLTALRLAQEPALRSVLLRSAAFYLFASAYWALLPLVARDHLRGGAPLYGMLVAAIGVGAVSGALLLPRARARFGMTGVLAGGSIASALAMTGYALAPAPWLGLIASLLAGASWIASLSTLNIAAQFVLRDAVRARGMALYSAVFYGCLALGSFAWGAIAEQAGSEAALLLAAGATVVALFAARGGALPSAPLAG